MGVLSSNYLPQRQRGMFTWPNQDDQKNMTKLVNRTKKFTQTNVNLWTWPKIKPLQWFFPKNARYTAILGIFSTGTYAGIGTKFVSSMKMLWKVQKKTFEVLNIRLNKSCFECCCHLTMCFECCCHVVLLSPCHVCFECCCHVVLLSPCHVLLLSPCHVCFECCCHVVLLSNVFTWVIAVLDATLCSAGSPGRIEIGWRNFLLLLLADRLLGIWNQFCLTFFSTFLCAVLWKNGKF